MPSRAEAFHTAEATPAPPPQDYKFEAREEIKNIYDRYTLDMSEAARFRKMADDAYLKQKASREIFDALISISESFRSNAEKRLNTVLGLAGLEYDARYSDPYGKFCYEGFDIRPKKGPRSIQSEDVCMTLGEDVKAQHQKAVKEGYVPPSPIALRRE